MMLKKVLTKFKSSSPSPTLSSSSTFVNDTSLSQLKFDQDDSNSNNLNQTISQSNLLIKKFNGLNITIFGTYEEPLFKAKDIGDLLGFKNIRETISDFTDREKGVTSSDTLDGTQNVIYLTERGLYKLLMRSRKKEAEQFQNWVFEVITEIRLNGKYDLEEKLKATQLEYQKEVEENKKLLEEANLKIVRLENVTYKEAKKIGFIYAIFDGTDTKIGTSTNSIDRKNILQTANANKLDVRYNIPCSEPYLSESFIHKLLQNHHKLGGGKEWFEGSLDFYKPVINSVVSIVDTVNSSEHKISNIEFNTRLIQKILTDTPELKLLLNDEILGIQQPESKVIVQCPEKLDDIDLFMSHCFEPSDDHVNHVFTMTEIIEHFKVYLKSHHKPIPNGLTYKNYPAKLKEKFVDLNTRRFKGHASSVRIVGGMKCICDHQYVRVLPFP